MLPPRVFFHVQIALGVHCERNSRGAEEDWKSKNHYLSLSDFRINQEKHDDAWLTLWKVHLSDNFRISAIVPQCRNLPHDSVNRKYEEIRFHDGNTLVIVLDELENLDGDVFGPPGLLQVELEREHDMFLNIRHIVIGGPW